MGNSYIQLKEFLELKNEKGLIFIYSEDNGNRNAL